MQYVFIVNQQARDGQLKGSRLRLQAHWVEFIAHAGALRFMAPAVTD